MEQTNQVVEETHDDSDAAALAAAARALDAKANAVAEESVATPPDAAATPERSNEAAAAPAATPEGSDATPPPAEQPQEGARYQTHLQKLMEKTRESKRQQDEQREQQEALDLARRIAVAKRHGNQAVLRELGIAEEPPPQQQQPAFDIDEILGIKPKKEVNPEVEALRRQYEEQSRVLARLNQDAEQRRQAEEQERMNRWRLDELQKISSHVLENKDKLEYLSIIKQKKPELAPENDVFRLIINMNQQGAPVDHSQASEAIEAYYDDLLDYLSQTEKFKKRFLAAAQPSGKKEPKTITKGLSGDVSSPDLDDESLSDVERERRALAAAAAAVSAKKR